MIRYSTKLISAILFLSLFALPFLLNSTFADDGWEPGRTIDDQPDLQGVWANNAITPVERPAMFDEREYLTGEEMQFLERRMSEITASGGDALFGESVLDAVFSGDVSSRDTQTGNYDQQWMVERTLDTGPLRLLIHPMAASQPEPWQLQLITESLPATGQSILLTPG